MPLTIPTLREQIRTVAPSDPALRNVTLFNRLMQTDDDFKDFARRCYGYLDTRLEKGARVRFDKYTPEQQLWCIITANAFICEGDHWKEYYFEDDYLGVRRERNLIDF